MKLGSLEIFPASDGPFKLDGGQVFGIVPKALWSRLMNCDHRNRVTIAMTSLVVRHPDGIVLIECGTGRKHNAKMHDIYGLSDDIELVKSLGGLGIRPEDVTAVILSHLHHDHAGSCTRLADARCREQKDKAECSVPTFPSARYFVQRGEWEQATAPNPITRGTYLPENLLPLKKAGQLKLLDGDGELLDGISVRVTGGHTDFHQATIVQSQGAGVIFAGDAAPLVTCLRPAYNTAFDHHPVETMRAKAELFDLAIRRGWLIWFYHDPHTAAATLKHSTDPPVVENVAIEAPDVGA